VGEAAQRAWDIHQLEVEREPKARPAAADQPATTRQPAVRPGRRAAVPHLTVAEARYISKDELESYWSDAVRAAARGKFPLQGVALHDAAYLAGKLVLAGRMSEDAVRAHMQKAARLAGVRDGEAERAIEKAWLLARAHGLEEVARGYPTGHEPGAFVAVAAGSVTYDHDRQMHVEPAALAPLPAAVLVHRGHDATREPVGIGIPRFVDGAIHVEAVFGTAVTAGDTWTLVRTGRLCSVSTSVQALEYYKGVDGRLTRGVLTAVDLVRAPADETATVGKVIPGDKSSPGQRRTQRLFDDYLDDARNPLGVDLAVAAQRDGIGALDVLAPIVAPLRAEHGRSAVGVA
jgi:hypothetical protein